MAKRHPAPKKQPAKKKQPPPEPAKPAPVFATAETMAAAQREISVSEFFAKNRHLLGFDNPRKALLTCIKEAVDNSLDACEEAGILPEVEIEVKPLSEDRFVVTVRDNGPGIVKEQIPNIFGKLLYGSKFHRLRMSRGQQGIGISAAGMYGLLTTGQSMKITSRTGRQKKAHYYEIQIDTKTNSPEVIRDEEVAWERHHGTVVAIELEGKYQKGRQSIDEYLEQTAIANPHVTMVYKTPEGETVTYDRATGQLPPPPRTIKPHPHGVELGVLIKMLRDTRSRTLKGFLQEEFSRVSSGVAGKICEEAKLYDRARPTRIARQEADRLFEAVQRVKIMNPSTDCLSPIGEDQILKGLKNVVPADFYAACTRPPAVYRGNPFQVEVALAYGGAALPQEELVKVLRFANRVPLLYQQSACAIYRAMVANNWKSYGLAQSKGALPTGPAAVVVHLASVWVPFTSESKEAIAHYPEIIKEIRLGLQEVGRRLSAFVNRRARQTDERKKRSYIETYMPAIAEALGEILGLKEAQKKTVISRLRVVLERTRSVRIEDERIIEPGEARAAKVGTWKDEEEEVVHPAKGRKMPAEEGGQASSEAKREAAGASGKKQPESRKQQPGSRGS